MPSAMGDVSIAPTCPAGTVTPAFARANTGMIPHATQGWRACSSLRRGDVSVPVAGMLMPRRTPAIVAWTPDRAMAAQSTVPTRRYGARAWTPARLSA